MRTELFSAVTDVSVTLWWDQPDQVAFPVRYTVLMNGKSLGGTERTHWTVEGLAPETDYCFQVCLGSELIGETKARTLSVPRRIDPMSNFGRRLCMHMFHGKYLLFSDVFWRLSVR